MLTNYKSQCESKVKKWIEDTTKKPLGKLILEDYQEFVVDYKVEVTNTLSTTANKSVEAGGGKNGELYHQEADFKKAIQEYLAKELSKENLGLLADELQKGAYGKFSETSTVKVANSILYEHTCKTCGGQGEIQCPDCRGKGEFRCDKCAGKGEIRCSNCGGKGEIRCSSCGGKGAKMCRSCNGSGRYSNDPSQICRPCNGSGFYHCRSCNGAGFSKCSWCGSKGIYTCSTCNGATKITCTTCNGTSEVTEIAQICVQTTPNYAISCPENTDEKAKQIIDKYIISNNTDISNITRTELRQDEKRVVESYQIQMPFAKFSVSFDDKKFDWVVCGKNLLVEEGQNEMSQLFKAKRRAFILKIVLGIIAVLAVLGVAWNFLSNTQKPTPQSQRTAPKQSTAQKQHPRTAQDYLNSSPIEYSTQQGASQSTTSKQSQNSVQTTPEPSVKSVAQSTPNQNIQASFDCAKASTRVEKLICSDEELASLDIELANAYANARNSLDAAGKKALLSEQRKWIEAYNQCDDKPCVLHNMQIRIKTLQSYGGK